MEPHTPVQALLEQESWLRQLAGHLAADDGDDVAQETWVRALEQRAPVQAPRNWLRQVAGNVARNRRRDQRRRQRHEQRAGEDRDRAPSSAELMLREERRRLLVQVVDGLAAPLREVVLLRYFEGRTPQQIAAAHGLPVHTVWNRLRKALQELRGRLDREFGDRRAWLAPWLVPLRSADLVTPLGLGALLMSAKTLAVLASLALLSLLLWLAQSDASLPDLEDQQVVAAADAGGGAGGAELPSVDPVRAEERVEDEDAQDRLPPRPDTVPGDELWGEVVVADTGAPVPGARLELLLREGDNLDTANLEFSNRTRRLASATSDSEGRFLFGVEPAFAHRLRVEAEGFVTWTVFDCTGGSHVRVELTEGARIEGRVHSEGQPLADVPIRVFPVGVSLDLATGRSASDGSFRFAGLQPGRVFVEARTPDHYSTWYQATLEPGGLSTVEIAAVPGRRLRGRVLDAVTGAPIPGAEVSDNWTFRRRVRTDGDGAFDLRGLSQNLATVHVRAQGYAECTELLDQGSLEPIELTLVQGGSVAGRVVDPRGEPIRAGDAIVGAEFKVHEVLGESDWIHGSIDANGGFALSGLHPDLTYWLLVRAPGYGRRVYQLSGPVAAGEQRQLDDVVLQPSAVVTGRLLDTDDRPIAGCEVSMRGVNADARSRAGGAGTETPVYLFDREVRTDADGRFAFAEVAGGSYRLRARSDDHAATSLEISVVEGESVEGLELRMEPTLSIAGTVQGPDGGPVPPPPAGKVWLVQGLVDGEMKTFSPVGEDGRFSIRRRAPGETLLLSMDRTPPGMVLIPRVVEAGNEDVQLRLQHAAFVTGRVVDADGQGVQARVWGTPSGSTGVSYGSMSTEADGTFRLSVAPDFQGAIEAQLGDPFDPESFPLVSTSVDGVLAGQEGVVLRFGR